MALSQNGYGQGAVLKEGSLIGPKLRRSWRRIRTESQITPGVRLLHLRHFQHNKLKRSPWILLARHLHSSKRHQQKQLLACHSSSHASSAADQLTIYLWFWPTMSNEIKQIYATTTDDDLPNCSRRRSMDADPHAAQPTFASAPTICARQLVEPFVERARHTRSVGIFLETHDKYAESECPHLCHDAEAPRAGHLGLANRAHH